MRSLLGRFHRPNARSQSEQLFMLNSLGDGSTLSLDFTTGVLDPRLTFTRSSNATFINSQGYVEYAGANLLLYSAYADTNWLAFGGYSKSYTTNITSPANDTSAARVTFSAVGHGLYTNNTQMGYTNTVGATYTMSAWIRATSNTTNLNIRFGDSAVAASPNIPITTTWTRYFYSYVAVSASGPVIQSASGTATGEFEMWGFQLNPGSTVQTYYPTTTAAYYAPRFDYDPTTLTPRGLLIEGAATNLLISSDELLVARGWGEDDIASRTTGTSPSNGTAVGFYPTTVSGYHRMQSPYQTGLSGIYTVSCWFKRLNSNYRAGINANTLMNAAVIVDLNGAGSVVTLSGSASNKAATIQPYPNDWYRVTLTGTRAVDAGMYFFMDSSTSTDATGGPFVGVASQGMLMWGAQLEAGSGASSYIPTGASTGTRGQDLVSITSTDFSSWWTSNNPLSMFFDISATSKAITAGVFRVADASGSAYGYQAYWNGTSFPIQLRATISSTVNSDVGLGTVASNTRTKFAYTINSAAVKRFKDGSLVNTVSSPTLPPDPMARFYFGGNPAFGGASGDFYLRGFKYWPTVLSDAEIQSLTT